MPAALLVEIAEHVVDLVAGDPTPGRLPTLLALCSSSKALVPRSQKYIFKDIVLFPRPKPSGWTPPPMYARPYQRCSLLVTAILNNPRLGPLVETLIIRFTGEPAESEDPSFDISRFADALVNLQDLRIHLLDLPPMYRSGLDFATLTSSPSWKSAMSSFIEKRYLASLTLKNIEQFPADMLLGAHQLDLYKTTLLISDPRTMSPRATGSVRVLICDTISALEFFKATAAFGEPGFQLVGHLLRFVVFTRDEFFGAWQMVLPAMKSLSMFEFSVTRTLASHDAPPPCPLISLNSASFKTLTVITIRLATYLEQPNIEIRLPYGYDWSPVLKGDCPALCVFQLMHTFQGCLDVHPMSFCAQWGALFNQLGDPTACQNLKFLVIYVEARALQDEDVARTEKNKRDAATFVAKLVKLFPALRYPPSFKKREESGFSCEVNTKASFGEQTGYPS